ncbi:MAG: hypothetical protein Q9160_005004 [Pyrenula sp. 1 TL-2023]
MPAYGKNTTKLRLEIYQVTLPQTDERPIVVLGGGVLGRRLACTWVAAGYDVILCDLSQEQRNSAAHYIEHYLAEYSKLPRNAPKAGSFTCAEAIDSAVENAWLVVEALPEKLPLKIKIMGQLDKHAPEDCIIGTNSSSYRSRLMLDEVDTSRRHRVCNIHYSMPHLNRTVELMTCGETHGEILSFLKSALENAGSRPAIARKESTGFIFNRLWAAIKREAVLILAEDVSEPAEIDKLFLHMFRDNPAGPCGMMDAVGLDTVALIEDNYVNERHLDSTSRDWLLKNFVNQGKLGAKSRKGGLYPPGETTRSSKDGSGHHDNLAAPRLYFLDVGLGGDVDLQKVSTSGRVMTASADGSNVRELVGGQSMPDGIDVSISSGKLFWTNMGRSPSENNGSVLCSNLDGSDVMTVVPEGQVHTPKQITIDHQNHKLYFCDREGLRVHRCDFDGVNHEIVMQTGDWRNITDIQDQTKWCVGIAVDPKAGKFYWSQKGPSKAGRGRIFQANMQMPEGETALSRSDVEMLFDKLPEPIDLEFEPDSQALYWTDRGEYPLGNTLNTAYVSGANNPHGGRHVQTLARHFHEAIGLKIDSVNRHIYLTDLGGAVYRFNMDGSDKRKIYDTSDAYTGIGLAHLH